MAKPKLATKQPGKPENVTKNDLGRIEWKLNVILMQLRQILQKEDVQMATIEELQAEVAANTDVTQSAVALIDGLAQKLEDALAQNDPAAVQEVVDQLRQNSGALGAAVTENTPHPDQTLPGDIE